MNIFYLYFCLSIIVLGIYFSKLLIKSEFYLNRKINRYMKITFLSFVSIYFLYILSIKYGLITDLIIKINKINILNTIHCGEDIPNND